MKISVLTPSYNSVGYIEKAIHSVLKQDYTLVEHIIMDGGSMDGTIEILKKYPSVTWQSEKDNGQSDAMNKAFAKSTGDIIVYLNADDYFEPNVFGSIIKAFKENDTDIVVGNFYNRYYNGVPEELVVPVFEFKKILFPNRYTFPLNPVSYFYRREVQKKIGEFPVEEHYAMDYWFLLRAFKAFKITKIEIALGTFYRTGANKTSLNNNTQKNVETMAYKYVSAFGWHWAIWYYITHSYFNIRRGIKYNYWKIPLKYIYYILFARNKYKSFTEFQQVGFKKHRYN